MLPRLLKLGFWAALLFALVMALLPQPRQLPGSPSDKVQHMLAFAVPTALALAAYPRAGWLKIGIGLACFGAFIELAQLIPMLGREGSWLDLAADCGAIAVVLVLGAPVRALLLNPSKSGFQP